jgi:DNA-binding NarL/FixJ family response regulator
MSGKPNYETVEHKWGLNEMELRVIQAIAEGRDTIGAGAVVSLSPETVRGHIKSIFRKMGCYNQTTMCLRAERAGLLEGIEV